MNSILQPLYSWGLVPGLCLSGNNFIVNYSLLFVKSHCFFLCCSSIVFVIVVVCYTIYNTSALNKVGVAKIAACFAHHFFNILSDYYSVFYLCLAFSLLLSLQDGKTPLYIASDTDDTDIVKLLLENKADPNISDNVSCEY